MATVKNKGKLVGKCDSEDVDVESNEVSWTSSTNGIKLVKTPPTGTTLYVGVPLTVTLTLTNTTTKPLVAPIFTDQLDPLITYIAGSVLINGAAIPPANVTFVGNLLTVKSPTDLAAGGTMVVTFKVILV